MCPPQSLPGRFWDRPLSEHSLQDMPGNSVFVAGAHANRDTPLCTSTPLLVTLLILGIVRTLSDELCHRRMPLSTCVGAGSSGCSEVPSPLARNTGVSIGSVSAWVTHQTRLHRVMRLCVSMKGRRKGFEGVAEDKAKNCGCEGVFYMKTCMSCCLHTQTESGSDSLALAWMHELLFAHRRKTKPCLTSLRRLAS